MANFSVLPQHLLGINFDTLHLNDVKAITASEYLGPAAAGLSGPVLLSAPVGLLDGDNVVPSVLLISTYRVFVLRGGDGRVLLARSSVNLSGLLVFAEHPSLFALRFSGPPVGDAGVHSGYPLLNAGDVVLQSACVLTIRLFLRTFSRTVRHIVVPTLPAGALPLSPSLSSALSLREAAVEVERAAGRLDDAFLVAQDKKKAALQQWNGRAGNRDESHVNTATAAVREAVTAQCHRVASVLATAAVAKAPSGPCGWDSMWGAQSTRRSLCAISSWDPCSTGSAAAAWHHFRDMTTSMATELSATQRQLAASLRREVALKAAAPSKEEPSWNPCVEL